MLIILNLALTISSTITSHIHNIYITIFNTAMMVHGCQNCRIIIISAVSELCSTAVVRLDFPHAINRVLTRGDNDIVFTNR